MGNPEMPSPEAEPVRVEIFEGLKQEIMTQGLSVTTPEHLQVFEERARAFVQSDAPIFLKGEMLRIVETQSQRKDVKAVVGSLWDVIRKRMIDAAANDRVAELEEMLAQGGQIGEVLMSEIEAFLAEQEPEKQSLEEMQAVGDAVVKEKDLSEMKEEIDAGTKVGDEAEDFLRQETDG